MLLFLSILISDNMGYTTDRQKSFFAKFVATTICLLLLLVGFVYYVDPFFQFRVRDNQYMLNPWFVNPGLARNGNYNTVIIGSSMVQNYDLSILRKDSTINPVKLASGAMNIPEMQTMYSLSDKSKVHTYILNFDLPQFNQERLENKYPEYLYKEGVLNKLKYIFSYEACVRYAPVDFALSFYTKYSDNISPSLKYRLSIDNIGSFSHESVYGKERVKGLYLEGRTVTPPIMHDINGRMNRNLVELMDTLQIEKYLQKNYVIVFPPYSALYWHLTRRDKYYDNFVKFIKHTVRVMSRYENVRIVYFNDIPEIVDLDNYTDITHFNQHISDIIVNNLYTSDFELNISNVDEHMQKLDSLVTRFESENKDWLN